MNMRRRRILSAVGLITAALAGGAIGQQDEKLGRVTFTTSCDPNIPCDEFGDLKRAIATYRASANR